MTDQTIWLTILSFLLSIITLGGGWIFKMVWARVSAIETNSQNTALAAFLGKDAAREEAWWSWRDSVDKRLDAKRADIKDHEHRITRLERNGGNA